MTMANLNITNSIDNILHLTRPRRKTDSAVDKRPPLGLDSTPSLSKKPSAQVLQGLTRTHHRRRASSTTTPQDHPTAVPSSTKTSATLFSTLTTPPVPSLPPFLPLRQTPSKQRLRYSSPVDLVDMAAADPRDRRAEPHATSASSFAPAASKPSYLHPRFAHHHPSFLSSSPSGDQAAGTQDAGSHVRPSSAFSFEYHLPLHEEALTASTPTAVTAVAQQALKPRQPQVLQIQRPRKHAQKSSVTIALDPSSSSSSSADPSDFSDGSSSARRPRLHERRSVPNFSLPHVVSQTSSISSAESSPKDQPKDESQGLQLFHQKQELFHQRHQRHKSVSAPLSPIDQNTLFAWRSGQPQQQQQQQQQNTGETTSGIINALRSNATKRKRQSTIIAQQVASRPWAKDAANMPLSTLSYSPGTRSSFVADSKRRAAAVNSDGEHHTPSRNEDLFLNIARSDSTHRDSLARSESRRSRFGFNGASLRSPTSRTNNTRNTPSPEQLRTNNPLRGRHISSASVAHTSSASAHPLDESSRPSRLSTAAVGSSARSTIGLPRSRLSRASLDASASSPKSPSTGAAGAGAGAGVDRRASLHEPRVFGSSTLSTIRSASRQPSAEPADRMPDTTTHKARQDGSESTLSTNAPSTVWDELEGLKSRIRNLELTGKLPPSASSQTAMSSTAADRPRTAATTVTTAFSSPPKHKRKSSMAVHVPEPDVAQVHPLLQSALAKAKNVVSSEVYRTLENTINDAAALSVMLNSASGSFATGSASVANGYSTPDKHSKWKADSVCRGLTELCIALSDAQQQAPAEEKAPPDASSDKEPSTPFTSFQRSPSFEPDSMMRRRSTSRALARLESRRTSLVNGVGAGDSSDNAMAPTTPDAKQATTTTTTPQERRQSQLFEQQPQTPPQTKPSSGMTPGPRNRPSRLSVSMRASTYPAEPKTEPKRDSHQDTLAERNTSHALALSRTLTDVGTPSSNRFNARNRLSTGYVPYRPSLPNSPHEPNFTPQMPQTPAAQTQAPPPPPPHQPQLQSQSQKSQQEEDKKPGEEKKTELPRSPSLQAISLRRSFMAPVSYTPGTARTGIQSGSRRFAIPGYNSGAPNAMAAGAGTSTVAETPDSFHQSALERQRESQQQEQQQEDVLQKFATPSSKIASGYKPTTTQKSRSRTGSLGTTLGTRRFGIRPRPVMNLENIVHL